jgi:murein L,D-transpeptidase YcbB/YkuD
LSEITGEALPTEDPTLFDAAVAAALVTYQQERGLAADGVLSDRTLLRLQVEIGLFDTVADAGAP